MKQQTRVEKAISDFAVAMNLVAQAKSEETRAQMEVEAARRRYEDCGERLASARAVADRAREELAALYKARTDEAITAHPDQRGDQ